MIIQKILLNIFKICRFYVFRFKAKKRKCWTPFKKLFSFKEMSKKLIYTFFNYKLNRTRNANYLAFLLNEEFFLNLFWRSVYLSISTFRIYRLWISCKFEFLKMTFRTNCKKVKLLTFAQFFLLQNHSKKCFPFLEKSGNKNFNCVMNLQSLF